MTKKLIKKLTWIFSHTSKEKMGKKTKDYLWDFLVWHHEHS